MAVTDSFSIPLLVHTLLCSSALAVSTYALYVNHAKENDDNFRALCDIDAHMSCSAALTSKYSKGFGVIGDMLGEEHVLNMKNSIYGIAFYVSIALLGFWGSRRALLLVIMGELLGVVNMVYLGYIMHYVLKDVCLVCVSLDAIHTSLLALHMYQYCCLNKTLKKKSA